MPHAPIHGDAKSRRVRIEICYHRGIVQVPVGSRSPMCMQDDDLRDSDTRSGKGKRVDQRKEMEMGGEVKLIKKSIVVTAVEIQR